MLSLLDTYLKAVNIVQDTKSCSTFKDPKTIMDREKKLDKIIEAFSPKATLIDQNGTIYHGLTRIREFYSSPLSPVLNPEFSATPIPESVSSEDPNHLRVEIILSSNLGKIHVDDSFEIKDDLIIYMHISL